ncbi:unknown [Bacteroides eggerthii CAG:109]|nr:unknown [Bacteroides eggerthii CAG:109]
MIGYRILIEPISPKLFCKRIKIAEYTIRHHNLPNCRIPLTHPTFNFFRPFDPNIFARSSTIHDTRSTIQARIAGTYPLAISAGMYSYSITGIKNHCRFRNCKERSFNCTGIGIRATLSYMIFFSYKPVTHKYSNACK